MFYYIILLYSKDQPITGHKGPQGECRYSSTLSLTSVLNGSGWLTPYTGCFTPGVETQYPLCRRLGGPQGKSGQVQKILPPLGCEPQTVQPLAGCCSDTENNINSNYCDCCCCCHACWNTGIGWNQICERSLCAALFNPSGDVSL
jgi:hypothetical protein